MWTWKYYASNKNVLERWRHKNVNAEFTQWRISQRIYLFWIEPAQYFCNLHFTRQRQFATTTFQISTCPRWPTILPNVRSDRRRDIFCTTWERKLGMTMARLKCLMKNRWIILLSWVIIICYADQKIKLIDFWNWCWCG